MYSWNLSANFNMKPTGRAETKPMIYCVFYFDLLYLFGQHKILKPAEKFR